MMRLKKEVKTYHSFWNDADGIIDVENRCWKLPCLGWNYLLGTATGFFILEATSCIFAKRIAFWSECWNKWQRKDEELIKETNTRGSYVVHILPPILVCEEK